MKLTVALSLFTVLLPFSELAFSAPVGSDPFCFRRLANGQIENLERMCPNKKASSNTAPRVIKNRVRFSGAIRKQFQFIEYNYDGQLFVATVKNKSKEPLKNVTLSYFAYKSDTIVDNGKTVSNRSEIEPGGIAGFKAKLDKEADFIEIVNVDAE